MDPATFKLQTVSWGAFSPLRTACIQFNQIFLSLYYHQINIVNIKIQSLSLFSKTPYCPFNIFVKVLFSHDKWRP